MRTDPKSLAWWFGAAVYLGIGIGGCLVFTSYVHDTAWREMFYSVWWVPSGALAFWLKNRLEAYLCARASGQQLQQR